MKNLVSNARDYLLSLPDVSEQMLDDHLQEWKRLSKNSIPDIYKTLLHHAKNRQGMPNSIGDINRLSGIFFDFDPKEVILNYKNYNDILSEINKQKISISGTIEFDNKKSHWVIYAKAAISAANFLNNFQSAQSFHDFVNSFYINQYSRLALPLLLKEELFGFGFALACDFLKESGYNGFVKPDTHLNEICRAAGITEADTDFGVFKDVISFCDQYGLIPYEFDKLIWLVGSGNFYLNKKKIKTNKNIFIDEWM